MHAKSLEPQEISYFDGEVVQLAAASSREVLFKDSTGMLSFQYKFFSFAKPHLQAKRTHEYCYAHVLTHTQQDFQDMDAIAKLEATTNASSEKFIETNKVATHISVHQLCQKIHFLSHFAVALRALPS